MPRIKEQTIYQFDELSDRAKDRARDWYRQSDWGDNSFAESVLEDAEQVCRMLGIELATRAVRLMNGSTRREPIFYWEGFSTQGSGACFEGRYRYAPGAARKLKAEWPQDTELQRIAKELQSLQKPYFYRLEAGITHRGRYSHEMSVAIDVSDAEGIRTVDEQTEEGIKEALRDVMRWVYRGLEKEYEYQNSDETVDENIRANEYEFDEEGNRA